MRQVKDDIEELKGEIADLESKKRKAQNDGDDEEASKLGRTIAEKNDELYDLEQKKKNEAFENEQEQR